MKTHAEAKPQTPARHYATPAPNALAHQAQLRGALLRAGVQPRLEIGAVNDPLEREADTVAERVMRMPDIESIPVDIDGGLVSPEPPKSPIGHVKAKASSASASTQTSPQLEYSLNSLNSGGTPLDASSRAFFEPRFGQDFSQVRLHTDAHAARMADSLHARAFTLGSSIAFAANSYSFNTTAGRNLLGHELAHVVQQQCIGANSLQIKLVQRQKTNGETIQTKGNSSDEKAPSPKRRIEYQFFGETVAIETYEHVAAFFRVAIESLQKEIDGIENDAVRKEVDEWIENTKNILLYFENERDANKKVISPLDVTMIDQNYDGLLQIRKKIHEYKQEQIQHALRKEHNSAIEAKKEAEKMQPALDDTLRAAFRNSDNSSLTEVVSLTENVFSVVNDLKTLAEKINEDSRGLNSTVYNRIGNHKDTTLAIEKYTEVLKNFGRGMAALNLALTVIDRSKRATEAEQEMKYISDSVGILSNIITVLSLPMPHFTLSMTILGPMLNKINQNFSVLIDTLHNKNSKFVEVGLGLINPNAEPGGKEMFDFMIEVMHAKNESGVPAPPGNVEKYLFENREKLGIGTGSDMPTTGILFWKQPDIPALRLWLFGHRKRVWAMLYGSMKDTRPTKS